MKYMIALILIFVLVIGYLVMKESKPAKVTGGIMIVEQGVQQLGKYYYPPKDVEKVMAAKRRRCSYYDADKTVWKIFKDEKYNWAPYMVWGDFNNDGACDFIVRLKNSSGGVDTIAYYKLEDSYGEVVLESTDKPDTSYLVIEKKGTKPNALERDSVYIENSKGKRRLDCDKIPVYMQEKK